MSALKITWSTPYGRSWTPVDEGRSERQSHALRVGDEVWLIDPIDCDGLGDLIADLGGVVDHVVVLLDRHMRDAEAVAEHFGARLHVVAGASRTDIPASAERFADKLPGSPFTILPVINIGKLWHERALWWPEHELLVVAESLGSADMFRLGTAGSIAVHPALRLTPPRTAFAHLAPHTVLFGHGPAVTRHATQGVQTALDESFTKAPSFVAHAVKHVASSVRAR